MNGAKLQITAAVVVTTLALVAVAAWQQWMTDLLREQVEQTAPLGENGCHFLTKAMEDWAVHLTHTRCFKLDTNTFFQGMRKVVVVDFATAGAGIGGGGFGGAGPTPAQAGQQGQGGQGANSVNEASSMVAAVKQFLLAFGVDLQHPGKSACYNDRLGLLIVHANLQDLDKVEQGLHILSMPPPQVIIEAKFAGSAQDYNHSHALDFDWLLGNTLSTERTFESK